MSLPSGHDASLVPDENWSAVGQGRERANNYNAASLVPDENWSAVWQGRERANNYNEALGENRESSGSCQSANTHERNECDINGVCMGGMCV